MESLKLAKQMIEFNKASFNNAYTAMVTFQEQSERMARTFIDQASWLPEEGKKILDEWLKALKTGREEYKKTVDESFQKVEDYFAREGKTE
jgi:polyhydroxyalkanoate synthesis regulator phasin